jgi:hypothetical protein
MPADTNSHPALVRLHAVSSTLTICVFWQAGKVLGGGSSINACVWAVGHLEPGTLDDEGMEGYLRRTVQTFWHQSGTAKMGNDDMSVVGGDLLVHGVQGLRIADTSVLPRITTGNTMAPSVVIGERRRHAKLPRRLTLPAPPRRGAD